MHVVLPAAAPAVVVPPGVPHDAIDVARALHLRAGRLESGATAQRATARTVTAGFTWCGPLASAYSAGAHQTVDSLLIAAGALQQAATAVATYARDLEQAQDVARLAATSATALNSRRADLGRRWTAARAAWKPLDTWIDHIAEEGEFRRQADLIADGVTQVHVLVGQAERLVAEAEQRLAGALQQTQAMADAIRLPEVPKPKGGSTSKWLLGAAMTGLVVVDVASTAAAVLDGPLPFGDAAAVGSYATTGRVAGKLGLRRGADDAAREVAEQAAKQAASRQTLTRAELIARFRAGNRFNRQQWPRYPVNEVRLTNNKVLDSYRPGREIVSRKNTQLGRVSVVARGPGLMLRGCSVARC